MCEDQSFFYSGSELALVQIDFFGGFDGLKNPGLLFKLHYVGVVGIVLGV